MHFPSAPWTSVGSGPGWVPGHSGTSSEAGHLLGSSLLLGPGPIWPGRAGTGIGSTLRCLSPAPLGPPVSWLWERSPVIAPVIPELDHGWGDPRLKVEVKDTEEEHCAALANSEVALTGERSATKFHRYRCWLCYLLALWL